MITALLITFAFAIGATAALECVRPLPRRNAFYVWPVTRGMILVGLWSMHKAVALPSGKHSGTTLPG